ncbi:MAG: succinate dehydrogenase assembly factor 2 [Gammaproteobacteria bacterium]|nr:succinate dehydrogenase assembly factor 2 [Gammaproteobacteria bacterium]
MDKNNLKFLCRRGLKELDMMLESYLDKYSDNASEEEVNLLIDWLQMDDHSLLLFIIENNHQDLALELSDKLKQC